MNPELPPHTAGTAAVATPRADQGLGPQFRATGQPPRPAWIEIDLVRLRHNFERIVGDKPPSVGLLSVVKDNAYGHGAVTVARAALQAGASALGVCTLPEALELRQAGIHAPLLLLGERHPDELPYCLEYGLSVSLGDLSLARALDRLAREAQRCVPVHLKIDTGMSRFGARWDQAVAVADELRRLPGLVLEGVMTHFAMSDEADKSFALEQLSRFEQVLAELKARNIRVRQRHLCNSGGFLDLPQAHFDLVRIGILPLGVYPSQVCRRLPGLEPVMTVKARIVVLRALAPGDRYGYGMRYEAATPRRIAVLPLGYGDGYPRLRNQGCVLLHGTRAPIIGGVAMDALAVDVTGIPGVRLWDEAVLMGRQGDEEVSAHDLAHWQGSVSYDVLAGWRSRLPRIPVGEEGPP
jgi:alanine racemase